MTTYIYEIIFAVAVSYLGFIELCFIMKHLCHWVFQHQKELLVICKKKDNLKELQEQIQRAIIDVKCNEINGYNTMKDGILYKDGFRIDDIDLKKNNDLEKLVEFTNEEIVSKTDSNLVNKTERANSIQSNENQKDKNITESSLETPVSDLNVEKSKRQEPEYLDDFQKKFDSSQNQSFICDNGNEKHQKQHHLNESSLSYDSYTLEEKEVESFKSVEQKEFESEHYNYSNEADRKMDDNFYYHKITPSKEAKRIIDMGTVNHNSSLTKVNEETICNPWGDFEHKKYKNSELWNREKRNSIKEENIQQLKAEQNEIINNSSNKTLKSLSLDEVNKLKNQKMFSTLKNESFKEKNDSTCHSNNVNIVEKNELTQNKGSLKTDLANNSDNLSNMITNFPSANIVIEYASDNILNKENNKGLERISDMIEGISDFYDFNASINPSRPPSMDRNKLPNTLVYTKESSNNQNWKNISKDIPSELSDFYDFNLKLNKQTTNISLNNERIGFKTSTEYLFEKAQNDRNNEILIPKNLIDSASIKLEEIIDSETISNSTNFEDENYHKTFSMEQKDIERLKDEYRSNLFKRSTYIGQSLEFDDDFEDLREKTRQFKRSRSKSRSVDNSSMKFDERQQLQNKILDEITKTTINYQHFSKNITQKFLDYERRGSDSALIAKKEIFIQIQDERKDSLCDTDYINELEGDEYHHFRRFSLNQEYPIEEYPDDYLYIEHIEDLPNIDKKFWTQDKINNKISIVNTNENETSLIKAEDIENESDDERQTIIEEENEICDSDITDMDKSEIELKQTENEEYQNTKLNRFENDKDNFSITSDDLLDKILEEDEIKYNRYSRRDSTSSKKSIQSYTDSEFDIDTYLAASATKSTRLRTRYGVGTTSTTHSNDKYSINSDHKPKKEYNWRKNFKLDDDDKPFYSDDGYEKFDNTENNNNYLSTTNIDSNNDDRKLSLGGESIILFSRSTEDIIDKTDLNDIKENESQKNCGTIKKTKKKKIKKEIITKQQNVSDGSKINKSKIQSNDDSSGVYELIKDGSMYPWFS